MIVATLVALALLFAPALASPDPSSFEPEGTSAMWYWVAWPVGGMLCSIVTLLWEAFGKDGDWQHVRQGRFPSPRVKSLARTRGRRRKPTA